MEDSVVTIKYSLQIRHLADSNAMLVYFRHLRHVKNSAILNQILFGCEFEKFYASQMSFIMILISAFQRWDFTKCGCFIIVVSVTLYLFNKEFYCVRKTHYALRVGNKSCTHSWCEANGNHWFFLEKKIKKIKINGTMNKWLKWIKTCKMIVINRSYNWDSTQSWTVTL